jgi:hypothetical protein
LRTEPFTVPGAVFRPISAALLSLIPGHTPLSQVMRR